ncbi:MAG: chromosome segregation protein SMC [Betaproteobacteria bacterium RIFCSPLOWO2_02_FULL_63_19]|nr:MAG: chromosome segregation protein SMC [Betaproteobacteria bacterium RIFCSPLOWO2_02_FULL_63_19]
MRLTHLKLSGFKSFVDPTSISVPGRLVGVVGPNGCGKSNIIDAVRWVLGESRASALRGDSMQDVIFNGTSLRNPVARASVELVFDNSMGKAVGQWSQYAEISVKRVLQRDGESSYFINNTHVRRRDVHDIFLGTGLGPRAYAIIEQGMISRIIEAKPEDLRVFLEEAAGISKYKERRRETEHRLADTRENLARVDDIRLELGIQIDKLEKQAEVARKFNELNAERLKKQSLLWLLRRNEAKAEAERHSRDIARTETELEAETARLREIENQLEKARVEHYASGDALGAAQGALYSANAEASRLEAEIRYVTETRQRLESQLTHLRAQQEAGSRQQAELRDAATMWQTRTVQARERGAAAAVQLGEEAQRLPESERVHSDAQMRLAQQHEAIAGTERAIQLEETHLAHAERVLQGLTTRQERLFAERAELLAPDPAQIEQVDRDLARSDRELHRQSEVLAQVESARDGVESGRAAAQDRVQTLERELSAIDAKLLTLQQIQGRVEENGQINDWIDRHQLGAHARLWQTIRVEPGWESAVESVLREKLHALQIEDEEALQRLIDDPPPAKVSAFTAGPAGPLLQEYGLRALAELVTPTGSGAGAVLASWLHDCFAVEGVPAYSLRQQLHPRVLLVNRDGHQFACHGVSFHAADPSDTGILARQREIEFLAGEARGLVESIDRARRELESLEQALAEHDEGLSALRAAGAALRQRHHERQLEHVKLTQGQERYAARNQQIERELEEIGQQMESEESARSASQTRLEDQRLAMAVLDEQLAHIKAAHDATGQALEAQRRALQQAEREVQETVYAEKECTNKIGEIERSLQSLLDQSRAGIEQIDGISRELADLHDEGLRKSLQQALQSRLSCEQALSAARARQDDTANQVRAQEEARATTERKLQPLRDRIGELRLKEQAARINCEQFSEQLAEAGTDEDALEAMLREGQKAAALQGEITRLANAIAELGAINMAALDELVTSQERKQFLDAQAADLAEALQTLDSAIRKIDRETRELLRSTFDAVNEHFSRLFPALFGGGDARLIMTGEEILDAGVQVMARPPGKKNTTIHLLSGGEKALAAIALIFSMFQLNPAPFCLLDEVDAPLDDTNTERFCELVRKMSQQTQFVFISHNKLTMEMAGQLIGVTMQEQGVSRVVAVDIEEALKLTEEEAA